MNNREAFKAGFLSRCISDGLTTPAQIEGRIKSAGVGGDVLSAAKGPLMLAAILGLAAPPIIGGVTGRAIGRAAGKIDETDIEEVKKRELIDELGQQTQMLQSKQKVPTPPAPTGRPLL